MVRLDLRELPPPEPMRRALEAVEKLGISDVLEIVTDREPMLLQHELERRGHRYVTGGSDGDFTTTIRRAKETKP
ncbi:MAG: DUF2249 domain-containing protein [Alphaproteobacteria bacterium]|nr:DUF2249 domain-containing protein [Alphaproteobacteria bacterium]MDE2494683.1 DUF2249 domain-containing protein [Alphaproteobacteria bacterium]